MEFVALVLWSRFNNPHTSPPKRNQFYRIHKKRKCTKEQNKQKEGKIYLYTHTYIDFETKKKYLSLTERDLPLALCAEKRRPFKDSISSPSFENQLSTVVDNGHLNEWLTDGEIDGKCENKNNEWCGSLESWDGVEEFQSYSEAMLAWTWHSPLWFFGC